MAKNGSKNNRDERREYRRRRRIRNQILAYLTLVAMIGCVVAGGYFGVKALRRGKPQAAVTAGASTTEGTENGAADVAEGEGEGTQEEYIPEDFTPSTDSAPEETGTPEESAADDSVSEEADAEGEADSGVDAGDVETVEAL